MCVCPELSTPKPLDQSKNVTVRSYHKLSREKNGQKNWPKSAKKRQKEPKFDFPRCHVAEPGKAGRSVVTSYKYELSEKLFSQIWQLYNRFPSWTEAMCLINLYFELRILSQIWHLFGCTSDSWKLNTICVSNRKLHSSQKNSLWESVDIFYVFCLNYLQI